MYIIFKNFKRLLKVGFINYAYFKRILKPTIDNRNDGLNTKKIKIMLFPVMVTN